MSSNPKITQPEHVEFALRSDDSLYWNGEPVTATEGRELLETAGFVRDYQGMTLYAAWK